MVDTEFDNLDKDYKKIVAMFPGARFNVAISSKETKDIVSDEKRITIKHTRSCYCYGDNPLPTQYFTIEGSELTNKYVIEQLIIQGLHMDCNHYFLEGFNNIYDDVFEIMVGS